MAEEFADRLNAILADPKAMGQILSLSKSLTCGDETAPSPAQAEEDLSPEAFSTLQAEQEAWEQGREASVQSLRPQNSDDPLAAARALAAFLRARGQELCKAIYDATGQLPSFPEIDAGPQG